MHDDAEGTLNPIERRTSPPTRLQPVPAASDQAVLVVAQAPRTRDLLVRRLAARFARVDAVEGAEQALARLGAGDYGLAVVDEGVDGGRGVDLLERMRDLWPAVSRALVSCSEDPALAFESINRAGASYLIRDPAATDLAEELLARCGARRTQRPAQRELASEPTFSKIIGESQAMRRVLALVERIARTDSTILVLGETGTGKDLIGRAIHDASQRRSGPWCAVNSAAFPETLLDSELFGHRRGSFTGATDNSKGLFEQADGGTLFLDEVAEMPLSMQAKLLRFLQTGEVRAVGSSATRVVDVRLVTATNKRLEREIEKGAFREDLFYRLAVIPIEIPPLRARLEDVPLLARYFATRVATRWGKGPIELAPSAIDALTGYTWPGNVRELENVIERAVALCSDDELRADDLPAFERKPETPATAAARLPESLPTLERRHIIETLERVGWNRRRAAALLQISTTTLWRRLKSFGIEGRSDLHAYGPSSAN
jgi:DNA-binding NtrC family response regulator